MGSATLLLRAMDRTAPDDRAIDEAARVIRAGGLVAFATETVYGLGADATNESAVARIFLAKGRPSHNPLIVHASDPAMARTCVAEWPDAAEDLAQQFWPGPLSLVLPRSAIIPGLVTAGRDTVAVRIPAGRVARDLIARAGRPVAAPSANRSNRLSPTTAGHVLRDLDGRIDMVLDSGPTRVGLESTVLDLTTRPYRILRPGPVTPGEIFRALGGTFVAEAPEAATSDRPASPGHSPVHYAPTTPSYRVELGRFADFDLPGPTAILTFAGLVTPRKIPFDRSAEFASPDEAAEKLYSTLHEWDAEGFRQIVVVLPPDTPEWRAVRDRLLRGTTPWVRHPLPPG